MSAEKTLELLKKLKEDPKAKELLDGLKKPASQEDIISCFAQIAAKLGYAITPEEILEVMEQVEARRKAQTEKIASDMKALNDDDVEDVAGGASRYMMCGEWHDGCRYSLDGFCVVNDACMAGNINYLCSGDWSDADCSVSFYCDGTFFTYEGNKFSS